MSNARLGLVVGLALGFAAAFGGPEAVAIVLFGGLVGLLTGRSIDGLGDLVAATDTLIQRAQVISTEWAARLRESGVRTATSVRETTAAVGARARAGAAASRDRVRAGAAASRDRVRAGAAASRDRVRVGIEASGRWARQVRARATAAAGARAKRRQAKASAAETRVLRLDDLTHETVELRDRPGLRLPTGRPR